MSQDVTLFTLFTGTAVLDFITILVLLGMLFLINESRRRKQIPAAFTDHLCNIMIIVNMIAAFFDGADYILEHILEADPSPSGVWLLMGSHTIYTLASETVMFLFMTYLICLAGRETVARKYWKFFIAPFVVTDILFLLNFFGQFLFTVDPVTNEYSHRGPYDAAILTAPLLFFAVTIFQLWKHNKRVIIVIVVLFVARTYFTIVLYGLSATSFVFTAAMIYAYLSIRDKRLLVQIGSALVLLFVLAVLLVGNAVTVSSFSSYLLTASETNSIHMREVIGEMQEYRALPWLIQYYMKQGNDLEKAAVREDTIFLLSGKNDLREITIEEAEAFTPGLQKLFAADCYKNISYLFENSVEQYSLMNTLFLMVPKGKDSAVILFSGERHEDGSSMLGDRIPQKNVRKGWENFEAASSQNFLNWTWKKYTGEDEFGFSIEVPVEGELNPLMLCNVIKGEVVSKKLSGSTVFRNHTILLLVLIGTIILILLYFIVLRPLASMKKCLVAYRRDKDTTKVIEQLSKIREYTHNEVGLFIDEFTSLTKEMEIYNNRMLQLTADKERAETEMRLATNIQESMLPNIFPAFPDRNEFDLYACMNPAREVGGDFYDYFLIDNDHLGLVIADVSGKGVPAALFMMASKIILANHARLNSSPAEVLSMVNREICANNRGEMFVTVWLGILDLSTGILTAANAGHEYPALKKPGGNFELFRNKHGFVIGGMDDIKYREYTMHLERGAKLFLYTDGVPEAENSRGEMFGTDRMLRALNDNPDADPMELLNHVRRVVGEYVGTAEQFDDLTMLCIEYNGIMK